MSLEFIRSQATRDPKALITWMNAGQWAIVLWIVRQSLRCPLHLWLKADPPAVRELRYHVGRAFPEVQRFLT